MLFGATEWVQHVKSLGDAERVKREKAETESKHQTTVSELKTLRDKADEQKGAAEKQLSVAQQQLSVARELLSRQGQLRQLQEELAKRQQAFEGEQKALSNRQAQLASGQQALNETQVAIRGAQQDIGDRQTKQLKEMDAQVSAGRQQIERLELANAKAEIARLQFRLPEAAKQLILRRVQQLSSDTPEAHACATVAVGGTAEYLSRRYSVSPFTDWRAKMLFRILNGALGITTTCDSLGGIPAADKLYRLTFDLFHNKGATSERTRRELLYSILGHRLQVLLRNGATVIDLDDTARSLEISIDNGIVAIDARPRDLTAANLLRAEMFFIRVIDGRLEDAYARSAPEFTPETKEKASLYPDSVSIQIGGPGVHLPETRLDLNWRRADSETMTGLGIKDVEFWREAVLVSGPHNVTGEPSSR